jgi:hypothetical protein
VSSFYITTPPPPEITSRFALRETRPTFCLAFGRAMALAISCRLLTAEAQVRARVSTRGICGRQSVTVIGFLRVFRFSLVNIIPLWFFLLIYHLRMYNRPLAGLSSETQSHPSTWTTLVFCILYQKVCSLTVRRVPHWVRLVLEVVQRARKT